MTTLGESIVGEVSFLSCKSVKESCASASIAIRVHNESVDEGSAENA